MTESIMSVVTMTAPKFAELCRAGEQIELIDVRTPVEFREVHVDFAKNMPLDKLDPAAVMKARNGAGEAPLYIVCMGGGRGQKACE